MIAAHKINYQIEGYNFKGSISLETDSIGSSTCTEIVDKFFLEYFDKLSHIDKKIFKMTFEKREILAECSKLSVYLVSDGSFEKEASEIISLDLKNRFHVKLMATD